MKFVAIRPPQVEYAMEAVKQGSATVGVKSGTHAVLVALKRASSDLSRYYSITFHGQRAIMF